MRFGKNTVVPTVLMRHIGTKRSENSLIGSCPQVIHHPQVLKPC